MQIISVVAILSLSFAALPQWGLPTVPTVVSTSQTWWGVPTAATPFWYWGPLNFNPPVTSGTGY
jgi:hypothetical protein